MTKEIQDRSRGHRLIAATEWPVRDVLYREQIPGRRPEWQILRGLCNGIAERVETYRTLREAREHF